MSAQDHQWPQIGQLFMQRGHLTQEQLSSALLEQQRTGQLLGEILVARGYITRLDLASAIGTQCHSHEQPPATDTIPAPAALDEPSAVAAPIEAPQLSDRRHETSSVVEVSEILADATALPPFS